MLEGVEKQSLQNELILQVQLYRDTLQRRLMKECQDFEKTTGLTISALTLHRISVDSVNSGTHQSYLADVSVKVEL